VDNVQWRGDSYGKTVENKRFQFAVPIVKLYKYLNDSKNEHTLSKQLLRSGTGIGANIAEAQQAQSHADFISKMSIALKEAAETNYWLRLLQATDYLSEAEFSSIHSDCRELEKMLTAIIKTARQ
jgi:four helix bundle protein